MYLTIYRLINVWRLVDISNWLGLFITNLCFPITEGISAMRLFRRSSQRKFGRQSNSSSGNDEIEFPSKYKNWKWQSKAKWIYKEEYVSFFYFDKHLWKQQTGCQRWQMKIIKMAIKFTSNCCKFSTSGGTWVSLFLLRSIVVLAKAEAVFISCSTAPSTASPTAMLTWRLVSLVSCHGYIVCLSGPRFCAALARVGSLRGRRLEVV